MFLTFALGRGIGVRFVGCPPPILSVDAFAQFQKDKVVVGLRCHFSLPYWGPTLEVRPLAHWPMCLGYEVQYPNSPDNRMVSVKTIIIKVSVHYENTETVKNRTKPKPSLEPQSFWVQRNIHSTVFILWA